MTMTWHTYGRAPEPRHCCPDNHCPRHTSSALGYSGCSCKRTPQAGTAAGARRMGWLRLKEGAERVGTQKQRLCTKTQQRFLALLSCVTILADVYWNLSLHLVVIYSNGKYSLDFCNKSNREKYLWNLPLLKLLSTFAGDIIHIQDLIVSTGTGPAIRDSKAQTAATTVVSSTCVGACTKSKKKSVKLTFSCHNKWIDKAEANLAAAVHHTLWSQRWEASHCGVKWLPLWPD